MDETMVVFLFNSDNPPESDMGYGGVAETVLLKHLFACWEQVASKPLSGTELKACHGDLFEHHPLGKDYCALGILAEMLQHGDLPSDNLAPEFATALSSGESVGFIPWAVGINPLSMDVAAQVNKRLREELPDFYLGMLPFLASAIFEETASRLSLPQDVSLEGDKLVGDWLGKAP